MHVSMGLDRSKRSKSLRASWFLILSASLFAHSAFAAAPTISGSPATWVKIGQKYSFTPTAKDADGQKLKFSIANKPAWASFNTSTGALTGTPSAVGLWTGIQISVTDGSSTVKLAGFSIRAVSTSNVAPTISGTPPTTATVGVAYKFQAIGKDKNGDPLVYSIVNKPAWANLNSMTGILSGTPKSSDVGKYSNIQIIASDGSYKVKLPAFAITVSAAGSTSNRAPTISGTPATSATVGTAYTFKPTASDPDGNTLGFSIQNRPSWASFSTANGTLSGTPTATGTHNNIIISVSDGKITKSLPAFSIKVAAATSSNTAPKISGSPATSVSVGSAYSFRPTASDANGDSLTFSITNRPTWASFNSSTGQLSGTPSATNVGTYSNIVIKVSDGKASASLPAFSIAVIQTSSRTAALTWTAPTQNTDGSALTNLAGYRIHYGKSASVLSDVIDLNNAGLTSYVFDDLPAGTYYFAIRAYSANGTQSDLSNIVSKTIK